MTDTDTDTPNQLLCNETFDARVRYNRDKGTYTISNLSRFDLQKITDALGNELSQQNVFAHGPQPHWWNDGYPAGDHKVWFLSWVEYFREARDTLQRALDR